MQVGEVKRFQREDGVNKMKLIEYLKYLNILKGYLPTWRKVKKKVSSKAIEN